MNEELKLVQKDQKDHAKEAATAGATAAIGDIAASLAGFLRTFRGGDANAN